jgi:hypothetical protein
VVASAGRTGAREQVEGTVRRLICENRLTLIQEVENSQHRTASELVESGVSAAVASDRAERYVIEAALMRRGYLRISGWSQGAHRTSHHESIIEPGAAHGSYCRECLSLVIPRPSWSGSMR